MLWYPTQAKTGLEWDTTALDRAGGGWSCRKRIYRSFASTRSKVKPEGRRRRSCRSRSSAASRLRSRVISNSRGPAILTSIWSPSFNSSASTTAAGRRTAKLFPTWILAPDPRPVPNGFCWDTECADARNRPGYGGPIPPGKPYSRCPVTGAMPAWFAASAPITGIWKVLPW